MKLFWTGTDSLMLIDYSMRSPRKRVYWWVFRKFIRIAELFIQNHAVISENLADNLRKFGVKKSIELIPTVYNTTRYEKIPHEGFNVLYYLLKGGDRKFRKWLYGYDIFLKIKEAYPDLNFIVVDGTYMMEKIYPITDFYLRCNRHDGPSRIRLECVVNDIPYYWSQKNPDFNEICKRLDENINSVILP